MKCFSILSLSGRNPKILLFRECKIPCVYKTIQHFNIRICVVSLYTVGCLHVKHKQNYQVLQQHISRHDRESIVLRYRQHAGCNVYCSYVCITLFLLAQISCHKSLSAVLNYCVTRFSNPKSGPLNCSLYPPLWPPLKCFP